MQFENGNRPESLVFVASEQACSSQSHFETGESFTKEVLHDFFGGCKTGPNEFSAVFHSYQTHHRSNFQVVADNAPIILSSLAICSSFWCDFRNQCDFVLLHLWCGSVSDTLTGSYITTSEASLDEMSEAGKDPRPKAAAVPSLMETLHPFGHASPEHATDMS